MSGDTGHGWTGTMTASPDLLKRIQRSPITRGGRLVIRYRNGGYSFYHRPSGQPLARLRLTGEGDQVAVLYPSHRGGWRNIGDFGGVAMPLDEALEYIGKSGIFDDLHSFGECPSRQRT